MIPLKTPCSCHGGGDKGAVRERMKRLALL